LRRMLPELADRAGFVYTIAVLPITVAALATTSWIARHLSVPAGIDRVLLPGLCQGDIAVLTAAFAVPVERGPKDLRDLPEFFGQGGRRPADYGAFDIEILAEINHAPQISLADLLANACRLRNSGADVIDLGCDPGGTWSGIGETVKALRAEGMRVSVDSFNL